jgi:antitoxin VapB
MPTVKSRAKLFRHGGSQAVRLPRDFRFVGSEVSISHTQDGGVLLEPVAAEVERRRARFLSLAGSCPDLKDVSRHPGKDIPRD